MSKMIVESTTEYEEQKY